MARKKLNRTYRELLDQANIRSKKYYQLNKEKCKKKSKDRYWKIKNSDVELQNI